MIQASFKLCARSIAATLILCQVLSVQAAQLLPIPQALHSTVPAPQIEASSWVLIEADSGWMLTSKDQEKRVDPASLTKLMTAYLAFDALKSGRVKAEQPVLISEKSWRAPGSRMFVNVGTQVSFLELLKGMVIQSGNDAAISLAEYLGGSELGFAALMNEKAAVLGLKNTHYVNASGLPHKDHYTSAYDVALLARQLTQDFPELYKLFSEREYRYNDITQQNRNGLLAVGAGYDGLKTGYTKAAGYCLAGSAVRNGVRYIAVVMGTSGKKARVEASKSLIEYGFSMYDKVPVASMGTGLGEAAVRMAAEPTVEYQAGLSVSIVVPKGTSSLVNIQPEFTAELSAPLTQGQNIGHMIVTYNGKGVVKAPLVAGHAVQEGSLFQQAMESIKAMLPF